MFLCLSMEGNNSNDMHLCSIEQLQWTYYTKVLFYSKCRHNVKRHRQRRSLGSFTQFFCVIFNAISISEYPSLSFSCCPRLHTFVFVILPHSLFFKLPSHFNFPFIFHILSLNLRFHFSTLLNNFYIVVRRRRMEKCKKVFSVLNVVSFVKR